MSPRHPTDLAPQTQVEYAMEAISNAGAAIGCLAKDGVVLIAEKKITSKVGAVYGGSALPRQRSMPCMQL
jgi:20S proteasome alpha/beta subunit